MRIRFISVFIAVMLMLSLGSTPMAMAGAQGAEEGYYVSTAEICATVNNPNPADRLNLRTKPSVTAPTLGKYYTGTSVEVLGDEKNGWVKVRFCNLEGYMQKKFLVFGEERGQVGSAIPGVKINNKNGTGLNLRKAQSMNSKSLGLHLNGEVVLVYGVGETWCHVAAPDGRIGFMLREKLSPVLEFKGPGSSGSTGGSGAVIKVATVNNPNPADRLNLRTSPSTKASTLGKYYTGVQVELLGAEDKGWIKVKIGNLVGYMRSEFLQRDVYATINSALPFYTINNTLGTGLNLREAQSTSSSSLGFYPNGQTGWVYGVSEAWCHVIAPDGKVGFMLRERLSPVLDFKK